MATTTATSKATCVLCEKIKVTYICEGCAKRFCIEHLLQHRTNIEQEFDQLQNDHDQLRQQINDLKCDSKPFLLEIEQKLNRLAAQMKDIHRENQFNETDSNDFKQRLTKLEQELNQSRNLSIQQHFSLLPSGKTQSIFF